MNRFIIVAAAIVALAGLHGCACQDVVEKAGLDQRPMEVMEEKPERNMADGGALPVTTGGEGPVRPVADEEPVNIVEALGVHGVELNGTRASAWFTILGRETDFGERVRPDDLQLISEEEVLEVTVREVQPLTATKRKVAIMVVLANHENFDPVANGVVGSLRRLASALGPGDAIGLVHYGTEPGRPDRIDIQSPASFEAALGNLQPTRRAEPDPFAAIEVATREFFSLEEPENFLRFVVVVGDGTSRWDSLPSRAKWQARAVGSLGRASVVPILIGVGSDATDDGYANYAEIAGQAHGVYTHVADAEGLRVTLDGYAAQMLVSRVYEFNCKALSGGTEVTLRATLGDTVLESKSLEVVQK